jgi:hypothetical protein
MSRLIILIVILIVVIGAAVALSRMDASSPLTRVEKIVPDNALAR